MGGQEDFYPLGLEGVLQCKTGKAQSSLTSLAVSFECLEDTAVKKLVVGKKKQEIGDGGI